MNNYYFAIASQSFLLDQEPLEEILRERMQYYKNSDRDIDFWFVLNPGFLNFLDKDSISFNSGHSLAAIVSLDKQFIQWLKLRVVFIQTGQFQSKSVFIPEN